jgi:four helix bundle protein
MQIYLDHEKLRVYQEAIKFVVWAEELSVRIGKKYSVLDHLDRASTSIALNIAEGNGKFTASDRCKFFDIARGSALESAGCLDVLVAKGVIPLDDVRAGKEMLHGIVSMIVGLIKSNSSRVHEGESKYGREEDHMSEYD